MAAYFQATGDSEGVDTLDGVVTGCSARQVSRPQWSHRPGILEKLVKLPWNQAAHRRMSAGLGSSNFKTLPLFVVILIIIGISTLVPLLSIFHQYVS